MGTALESKKILRFVDSVFLGVFFSLFLNKLSQDFCAHTEQGIYY